MTPQQQADVTRRAQQDAAAHLNGYPNANLCPYSDVKSATLWRSVFDKALKGDK